MSFVESITPYIPELLGVLSFILGYFILNTMKKPSEAYLVESDLGSLIQDSISEGHIEKAILYLEQYSAIAEIPDIKLYNTVLRACTDLKHSERAGQIFETMKQNRNLQIITAETYEIVANAMNDARKPNKLLEILSDIPKILIVTSEPLQYLFIDCHIRQGRFEEAEFLFNSSEYKQTLFPKFLNLLMKSQNREFALQVLKNYRNLAVSNENLLVLLENASDSELAIELFGKISSPSALSYQVMAKVYTRINALEEALSMLQAMASKQIVPEEATTTVLIDLCGKMGRLEVAEEVYKVVRLGEVSIVTLNAIIEACVRCQNMTLAWEYLDEMNRNGLTPDNFTYSSLIKGIKNEGDNADLDRAFGLLSALKSMPNLVPDEILYNCLLDACVSTKKLDKALELFSEMPKHDEISYNTLIKGFSQSKQLEKATEMLETMKKSGLRPNEVTYNSIIDTCIRCNQSGLAWDYFEEMESFDLSPDNFTYSTLVKGIKAENTQELYRTFRILDRGRVAPDEILFNCLIDACVRVGDVKKAVDVFIQMKDSSIEPSSVTYGIMIKAYGQANMLQRALDSFKEMKSKHLKANDVTYGCLLDACVKSGEITMAQDIFASMQSEGIILNTILYTTMIKGYAKTQDLKKALELLEEMKKDVQPNNVTYNSLLDCAVRCEDLATANSLFEEMQQIMKPDLISYSTMIKGLCRAGEVTQALFVLNTMRENLIFPDEVLFNSLLDGCAKIGNLEIAEKVYSDMKSLKIRPSNVTYSILIKLYGKNKQVQRALEVLEDMKREKVAPGMIVYTCLLQACIRGKQIHKALQLYADMVKSGVKGDKVTFNTLVNGCVYAKQLESAYKIALHSFDSNVRLADDVYNNLLRNLLAAKRTQWASEISEKLKQKGFQTENLTFDKPSTSENHSVYHIKKISEKKTPMGLRHYNVS